MRIITDKNKNLGKKNLDEDDVDRADHEDEDEAVEEEDANKKHSNANPGMTMIRMEENVRSIGLFGSIDAIKVATLIGALMDLSESDEIKNVESDNGKPEDVKSKDEDEDDRGEPIEFLINTPGGEADEMFALYDIMRLTKKRCDIETFGLGKVMSAGVLILAAGTKGKRKIGKNCRVMIHNVMAGSVGSLHNLENEIKEIKYIQQSYISALSEESGMPIKKLQKLLNRKVNVYLSAEEAVSLGIADIIV